MNAVCEVILPNLFTADSGQGFLSRAIGSVLNQIRTLSELLCGQRADGAMPYKLYGYGELGPQCNSYHLHKSRVWIQECAVHLQMSKIFRVSTKW